MKHLPQWTRRVAMDGSGRDPLGLSRVSDALTDFLLPAITTTTDRARYYSFYTWVIADIEAKRQSKGKRTTFEEEFLRRDAAFALASRLGKTTDLPVVGVRQVDATLASADEDENLRTNFRILPSNGSGGYGQYYAGCLHALDLVRSDEEGELIASPDRGRKLAAAFASATARSRYLAEEWRERSRVPMAVIKQSSKHFSLDALSNPAAENEREILISLFFDLGQTPTTTRRLCRQATLGLFLHVLKSCAKVGKVVIRRTVDRDAIFWPHYYCGIEDEDHEFLPYHPAPAFAEAHAFWRQFCAHQFLAFALEELLAGVLAALAPYAEGLTPATLVDELTGTEFVKDLEKVLKAKCATPAALLAAVGVTEVPDVACCLAASKRFHGSAKINEWSVCWDEKVAPKTRLGRALLLLVILYAKWRGRSDEDALLQVQEEAGKEVWLGTLFPWLDEWLEAKPTWTQAIEKLLDWTAMRHENVKFQKRKLDASWFEMANGRFVKQQDYAPSFRASRHGTAATILQDLGLIEHGGLDDPLKLTTRGRQVLDEVTKLRS
jgi:hypothetical protein